MYLSQSDFIFPVIPLAPVLPYYSDGYNVWGRTYDSTQELSPLVTTRTPDTYLTYKGVELHWAQYTLCMLSLDTLSPHEVIRLLDKVIRNKGTLIDVTDNEVIKCTYYSVEEMCIVIDTFGEGDYKIVIDESDVDSLFCDVPLNEIVNEDTSEEIVVSLSFREIILELEKADDLGVVYDLVSACLSRGYEQEGRIRYDDIVVKYSFIHDTANECITIDLSLYDVSVQIDNEPDNVVRVFLKLSRTNIGKLQNSITNIVKLLGW